MANLTGAADMWKTWAWWKNFNLARKIKVLILNKYIRVNVRHRAFKCWFAQTSGFVLLATVATLNPTTQKSHPVYGGFCYCEALVVKYNEFDMKGLENLFFTGGKLFRMILKVQDYTVYPFIALQAAQLPS